MFILTDNKDVNYGLFESKDTAYKEVYKQLQLRGIESYIITETKPQDILKTIRIIYGSTQDYFILSMYSPSSIQHQL
jgi:hypothetical protein